MAIIGFIASKSRVGMPDQVTLEIAEILVPDGNL
jgi:hypothetical protein